MKKTCSFSLIVMFSITLFANLAFSESEIKIAYAQPWRAGIDTVDALKIRLSNEDIIINLVGTKKMKEIDLLSKGIVNMAVIDNAGWNQASKKGYKFRCVAVIGPYLVAATDLEIKNNKMIFAGILKAWQEEWKKSGYPYGVQPPKPYSSTENCITFSKGMAGKVPALCLSPEQWDKATAQLVGATEAPVGWIDPKKLVIASTDYYLSQGLSVKLKTASAGYDYYGIIRNDYEGSHIELDQNPCNLSIINITEPYTKRETTKTIICDGLKYFYYRVKKN